MNHEDAHQYIIECSDKAKLITDQIKKKHFDTESGRCDFYVRDQQYITLYATVLEFLLKQHKQN